MMFFILFLLILSFTHGQDETRQIIHININEESPISTILFTTTTNITYRLFDSGRNQNSFIYYNASNGHILLSHSLDREYLCSQHICSCTKCQLIIELIEWQLPYRLLKLILNVDDINDHTPRFSSNNYKLNVVENVPIGFELPIESAYDADLGENGRIDYELRSESDGPFELVTKLNGGLALKVISKIDREQQDTYQYELIVFDYGIPRKQSSAKLFIHVDDVNDNPVVLDRTYIQLHISEHTPMGTELTNINATDKDIGLNGQIHYSISYGFPSASWRDHFRIGDSTGILTLIYPLDYESEQSYRLTVQVRDRGENSVACFVTIDISVVDENDNAPQAFITFVHPLINNSIIPITENTPVGEILAHVSISDADSGLNGEMSYEVEQGGEFVGIKILDKRSFLLVMNNLLDREDEHVEFNRLTLTISDYGKPPKFIRLDYDVHIIDMNDSPPKFNPSLNCNLRLDLSKNRSLDEPLFQINAVDFDSGDNGLVSYSILPPFENVFIINNQGQVFCDGYLNDSSSYDFQIMAMDNGKPVRLNSTYSCRLTTFTNHNHEHSNKSLPLINGLLVFQYNYLCLAIIFLIFILLLIVFTTYKLISNQETCLRRNKTYHLYVTIPRKSSYMNNESISSCPISDVRSEEHERLVQLTSDHTCDKDSLSDHHQFSSTARNNSPSSTSSIRISNKSSRELIPRSRQESRPVSLSISTATTCTSTGTDVPNKLNNANPTVIRLAEEENTDF